MPNKTFDSEFFIYTWNPEKGEYDVKKKHKEKNLIGTLEPQNRNLTINIDELKSMAPLSGLLFRDLISGLEHISNQYG